jgi:hypothetical protein
MIFMGNVVRLESDMAPQYGTLLHDILMNIEMKMPLDNILTEA